MCVLRLIPGTQSGANKHLTLQTGDEVEKLLPGREGSLRVVGGGVPHEAQLLRHVEEPVRDDAGAAQSAQLVVQGQRAEGGRQASPTAEEAVER
eukprot:CAMPEP_0183345460 /NCGR_PEP_ID=MMETSP0164_2-20130417/10876_1 /TAXON_ID=221442 /ORGANISM="Coccolithus pelagicus ssp braarudi, Strain PLY182g" /LENGTH=93 /DNA_ID=CAMNT_0025516599 /DNA_START=169 /DNA_END=447 /DNA_ORIENTATION=-